MLRHGDVVAGGDGRSPDMRGQRRKRRHDVIRHVTRLVVRRLEILVDADSEDRQGVEEEGVEMIGIEHHDQVWPRRGELFFLRPEQFCDLAIRPIALDEMREDRGMRYAETGDDLGHGLISYCLLSPHATGWPISLTFTARMRWL